MVAKARAPESAVTIRLVNSRDVSINFYLEPWGEAYEMPPSAIFDVLARGIERDALEVVYAADSIAVWGGPGSVVRLFHGEVELGADDWDRSPVPSTPSFGHPHESRESGILS